MRHDSRLIRIAGQTIRHRQSAISKLPAGRRCRRGQPNAAGAAVRKRSWTEAGPDRMEAAAVADGSRSRRSMEVRIAGQLRGIRRVNLIIVEWLPSGELDSALVLAIQEFSKTRDSSTQYVHINVEVL